MALRDENKEFEGHNIDEIQIYAIKYQKGDKLFSFDIDDDYIEELKEELQQQPKRLKIINLKRNLGTVLFVHT